MSNKLLDQINYPADLRRLKKNQLVQVSKELRNELIDVVSETGGHLGAGLGVVELTVALHYVFNTPKDKLVWDVSHQCYPHKIITGRKKNIRSLRDMKNYEVIEKDCFNFFQLNKKNTLKFDIIFVDPPYQELRVNEIIEKIIEQNFLSENGIIIIHRHKKDKVELTKKINIFEERFYGISKICFCN